MPVSWVEHRGHDVLYVDYRNLGPAECLETLHDQATAIDGAREPVLTLVDARGVVFGSEFMRVAKIAAMPNTARTRKRAVVGADGFNKVLLAFFNSAATPVPMKPFATIEEALDYLAAP
jgi:hypothetical protein